MAFCQVSIRHMCCQPACVRVLQRALSPGARCRTMLSVSLCAICNEQLWAPRLAPQHLSTSGNHTTFMYISTHFDLFPAGSCISQLCIGVVL